MEKKSDDSLNSVNSDRLYSDISSLDDYEESKADDETTVPQDESETNIQMTVLKEKQF